MGSLAVASTTLFACAPLADSPQTPGVGAGLEAAPGAGTVVQLGDLRVATVVDARPAALVNGQIIEWGEMRDLLNEAAGAKVLREVILHRMVSEAVGEAGLTITAGDLEAERALFYGALSDDPDVAVRLAQEVRARQGLGSRRFRRLLLRNASLRALVRDDVEVTEEAIRRLYQIRHGARRQTRLIVLPTLSETQAAINRVRAGEFFGDVAVEISTDSSAPRGGLLEPISRADPTYPLSIRQTLWSLAPGEISPPVLLGESYAVLTLVRVVEGDDVDFAAVRPELERLARLDQELLLMDQLARQLLAQATVTVFDDALNESWQR